MGIELYNGCLAKSIKGVIKQKGLKQKNVAEKAGFSEKEFSAILNNRRIIRVDEVMDIANALGVTPNELYGITPNGNEAGKGA